MVNGELRIKAIGTTYQETMQLIENIICFFIYFSIGTLLFVIYIPNYCRFCLFRRATVLDSRATIIVGIVQDCQ